MELRGQARSRPARANGQQFEFESSRPPSPDPTVKTNSYMFDYVCSKYVHMKIAELKFANSATADSQHRQHLPHAAGIVLHEVRVLVLQRGRDVRR